MMHLTFVGRQNIVAVFDWDVLVANAEDLARWVGEGLLQFDTAEQARARGRIDANA